MAPVEDEWKKGSAELLILSLLEAQPRHGYDIGGLIDLRSGGMLHFHVASLQFEEKRLAEQDLNRVLPRPIPHRAVRWAGGDHETASQEYHRRFSIPPDE